MKKNYPRYTLRIPSALLYKLGIISDFYGRTKNKELTHIVKKHIEEFEKIHGEIELPDDLEEDN